MKIKVFIFLFFISYLASAQSASNTNTNTFYRKYNLSGMQGALGIVSLPDDGFIGTGQHEDNGSAGDCDVYVYRVDACGSLVWMKLIGTSAIEGGKGIHLKRNNNLLITGLYNTKGMLFEMDLNGNLLWEKRYNNTSFTLAVDECPNGDLIVTTMTVTGQFGLMRCDSMGNVIWSKTISDLGDYPITALVMSNGNIFINSTFNIPGKDFSAMVLDPNGNIIWSKTYGGIGYVETDYQSWGTKALFDSADTSMVIIGQTTVAGSDDIICVKLSLDSGTVRWSNIIGDTGSEQARDIVKTDKGYAIIGNTNGYPVSAASNPNILSEDMSERDVLLLNVDFSGNFLWAKTYGGIERDKGIGVRYNTDNTFLIDAYTSSPVFGNFDASMDPLFIKTDSNGVVGCQYNSPVLTCQNILLAVDTAGIVSPANISDSVSVSVVSPYIPPDSFRCLECTTIPVFLSSDTVVCVNQPVVFINTTVIGLLCLQKWNIDGILYNGSIDTIQYAFSTPGVYTVKLYSDCGGSTDTFKVNIRVNPAPVCNFTAADNCVYETTNFINNSFISSGNVASWDWNFGDNAHSNVLNPSHTYNTPGNYPVKLTAVSDFGCVKSVIDTVNIFPVPVASFTGSGVCLSDSLHVINNSVTPFPVSVYSWLFDGGSPSSQRNAVHLFQSPGSHTVELRITDINGCKDDYTRSIDVYAMPHALFELPSICDVIPEAKFSNASTNSVTWYWDFGDEGFSREFSPTHSFQYTGIFKVSMMAVSEFGCMDSISGILEVREQYNFWIPNAFTPNNDGMNDIFIPKTEGVSSFLMDIYDRWGVKIYSTKDISKGWDSTINGRQAQEDVYVYKINVIDLCGKQHAYVGHFSLIH